MRLSLNTNLSSVRSFSRCGFQRRTYVKPIWGLYNVNGIKISKLKLNLRVLFPISFCNWSLEFINIINHNISNEIDSFYICFKLVQYSNFYGIQYVEYSSNFCSLLVDLPKVSNNGLINIGGIEKVLISQLIRHPDIRIGESGNNNIYINFLTSGIGGLCIETVNGDLKIKCNNCFSDYISMLLFLGTKGNHIAKLLTNNTKIVYIKGQWCYIAYDFFLRYYADYSFRRSLRVKKNFSVIAIDRNTCVTINNVFNKHNVKIISIGDKIVLNSFISLNYTNILDVSFSDVPYKVIRLLTRLDDKYDSLIKRKDLELVNLMPFGRCLINILIHQAQKFSNGLDFLTKQDLIIIWYRITKFGVNFKWFKANTRVLKGVGDIIIEIIENIVKKLIKQNNFFVLLKCYLQDAKLNLNCLVQSEITDLFNTSNLCQYANQLNSLSELSHRNKLTYLGEDGCNIKTTDVFIRNIYRWYFGKICPIASPEGQIVGLISALAFCSNIDVNGYITTGYYKLNNGLISNNIVYLNCYEESKYCIVLSPSKFLKESKNKVCIINNKIPTVCLPMHAQAFSYAVNLIPFLSHNDPTRALMAANMLKQAIPLIRPQAPLVGTGNEYWTMMDTCHNIVAHFNGIVVNVDSISILLYNVSDNTYKTYLLHKFDESNQGVYVRLRPVVNLFQVVKRGDVLAECQSSVNGKISLGANLLVAFICLKGLNYEDAILISKDVVDKGILDSFHIIELETNIHKTQYESEIIAPIESKGHLFENGIIKVGSVVRGDDVLVWKSFAKETNLNRIDNGNIDINIISLKVPKDIAIASVLEVLKLPLVSKTKHQDGAYDKYISDYVIITKKYIKRCYTLLKYSEDYIIKNALNLLYKNYILHLWKIQKLLLEAFNLRLTQYIDLNQISEVIKIKLLIHKAIQVGDKVCGRHGNKGVISKIVPKQDMPFMADGTPIDIVLNPLGVPSRMNLGQILETNLGFISYKLGMEFKQMLKIYEWSDNKELFLEMMFPKICEIYPNVMKFSFNTILKLIHELANGVNISCSLFDVSINKLIKEFNRRSSILNIQFQLYDGITGLPFDNKSTVGIIYILKLNHLVDNKICARSVGPYSAITYQPLKGKTNKGGQKLGEMEIWTLQSYGVAYLIKEVLTVKCDNIIAKMPMCMEVLHKIPLSDVSWNESFLVVLKELFAMCISVSLN